MTTVCRKKNYPEHNYFVSLLAKSEKNTYFTLDPIFHIVCGFYLLAILAQMLKRTWLDAKLSQVIESNCKENFEKIVMILYYI